MKVTVEATREQLHSAAGALDRAARNAGSPQVAREWWNIAAQLKGGKPERRRKWKGIGEMPSEGA